MVSASFPRVRLHPQSATKGLPQAFSGRLQSQSTPRGSSEAHFWSIRGNSAMMLLRAPLKTGRKQSEMYFSLAVLKTQAGELSSPIRTGFIRPDHLLPVFCGPIAMILAPLEPRLFMGYAQKRLLNRTMFLHPPAFQVLARCILTNVVVDGQLCQGLPPWFSRTSYESALQAGRHLSSILIFVLPDFGFLLLENA